MQNKNQNIRQSNLENRNDDLLSWRAKGFEKKLHPKWRGPAIFLTLLFLLVYGLFFNNLLLSVIAILLGLLFYLFEKRDEEVHEHAIFPAGILSNDQFYEFDNMDDFWIFYEGEKFGRKEISFKTKRMIFPYVYVPIGNADPLEIREVLKRFLPEKKHEENWVDLLERMIL